MTDRLDIARKIVEETCPHRRLKLENIQMFSEVIQCRKFHKGDIILSDGEVCTCLAYIEKGLIRQHYVKHDKDMTEHISCEGGVVFCIESYFNGTPTHLAMVGAGIIVFGISCKLIRSQHAVAREGHYFRHFCHFIFEFIASAEGNYFHFNNSFLCISICIIICPIFPSPAYFVGSKKLRSRSDQ